VLAMGQGGVPVGAYMNGGKTAIANDVTASTEGVPAPWAMMESHKPFWPHCQATTKKGDKCPAAKVTDPDGVPTTLCVGHWQAVLRAFKPEALSKHHQPAEVGDPSPQDVSE